MTAKIELSIIAALAKALPELESAKKNKANPAFKSKYADLAAVNEALEPIAAHGLWYRQHVHECADGVIVETIYIHESGQTLSAGALHMPATKKDAQGFGSALTYARRYSLQTAFGLATEDDDGNAAVKSTREAPEATAKRVALDGPITSITALQTAAKELVHEMSGCGDTSELSGLLHSKECLALIAQVKRDLPQWWDGGPDMPEKFVPLRRRIEMKEYEMAQQVADIARS